PRAVRAIQRHRFIVWHRQSSYAHPNEADGAETRDNACVVCSGLVVTDKVMPETQTVPEPSDAGPEADHRTQRLALEVEPGTRNANAALGPKAWRIRLYKSARRILGIAPAASIVFATFVAGVALFAELYNAG